MNPVIVALDVESGSRALTLADSLRGAVGAFKIGSRLFTLEGPDLVRRLVDKGDKVFLDLKFHDIPNTVAQAVGAAAATGAWMVNVHASGGVPMMQAAALASREAATRAGRAAPLVIGVTVLTSLDAPTLARVGVSRAIEAQVEALARLSEEAGLDGVVASPLEAAAIRRRCGPTFLVVTPGIRGASAEASKDDQHRTMTPTEAVQAGATYIVIGRPIIGAEDPKAAAEAVRAELTRG
jgi:orotidine-5'-phosphate decarboxylase